MKLAANWIMSDIAAYMKNEELTINEVKLSPQELAELIASIKNGTISGKIGKQVMILFFFLGQVLQFYLILISSLQILFELLAKGGTVKGLIEEKDLVQASCSLIGRLFNLNTLFFSNGQMCEM